MLIRPIQGRHSWVLLGPNGGGKGTLAKFAESYGYNHIDSGEMLRGTGQFQEILRKGGLAASEATYALVRQRVEQCGEESKFSFDGYPRTVEQCERLLALLRKMGHDFAVVDIVTELSLSRVRALNGPGRGKRGDEEAIDERHGIYLANIGPIRNFWRQIGTRTYSIDNNGSEENLISKFEQIIAIESGQVARGVFVEVGKPNRNTILV